jgi:thiol-disulfide isomerase/thioredoxin
VNLSRRITAIGVTGALVLSACGDDDGSSATVPPVVTDATDGDTVDDTADDTADTVDDTADGTVDEPAGVVPTIAPDLPDEFLEGTGPVAIVGDPLPGYPDEGADPAIGMTAPVLVGETFDGESVTIDAAVDGPTWIVFLAHWCPHCNDEIPVINQLRDEGRIPEGVNVVGVSTAFSPDRPNWPPGEWLDDKDWTFTAIPDGIDTVRESYIAASGFGVGGFPFSVLIDGDGTVTARWSGERPIDEIESLLNDHLTVG